MILRILALGLLAFLLLFFWNSPIMLPFKVFVVYLHEISHAIAAVVTGGEIQSIAISWNESGYMKSRGGIFFITAIAGYLGSMIWGSAMLYSAMQGKYLRPVSFFTGVVILAFTFMPQTWELANEAVNRIAIGIFWGVLFLASATIYSRFNHSLLFFSGGLTTLYSLYDLDDFFSGNLMNTDAGILARHYFGNTPLAVPFAWLLAIFISALSIWIVFFMIRHSLRTPASPEAEEESQPDENTEEIPPQMLEWLKKYDEMKRSDKE